MGQKKFVKVDSQILNSWSKCETEFKYMFVRNLRPMDQAYQLERGQLIHNIHEKYYQEYKASKNRASAAIMAVEYGRSRISLYDSIDVARGIAILDNMREYFNYYSGDKYIPVDVEKIHKKVIFEDDDIAILYVGKIDATLLGDDQFPLVVMDHKGYDRWFDPLGTDNQFSGYAHLVDVRCVIVNKIGFQSSYAADKKFRRVKLVYTPDKLQEWVHNTARLIKDMVFFLEEGVFPMRRSQCGMYGGCNFLKICELDPRARDMMIDKFYKTTEPWDPEKVKE
jgi:hypothetical protein